MPAAFKGSGQKGVGQRAGQGRSGQSGGQTEDIGVIVHPGGPGLKFVRTQGRPDALMPVGDNGHSNARAADQDAPGGIGGQNFRAQGVGVVRVINAGGGGRAKIAQIPDLSGQMGKQISLKGKPGVIRSDEESAHGLFPDHFNIIYASTSKFFN
jgi:hypothetical protein